MVRNNSLFDFGFQHKQTPLQQVLNKFERNQSKNRETSNHLIVRSLRVGGPLGSGLHLNWSFEPDFIVKYHYVTRYFSRELIPSAKVNRLRKFLFELSNFKEVVGKDNL